MRIHSGVDFGRRDLNRRFEGWRREPVGDAPRQVRMVFIDNSDGEVGRLGRGSGRGGVDRYGERERDQREHDRVGEDASQFLDREPEDISDVAQQFGEPIAAGRVRLRPGIGRRLFLRILRLARERHFSSPACVRAHARR